MVNRVHTFKIRVYGPAVLPMLAVYSQSVYLFLWSHDAHYLSSSFAGHGRSTYQS